MPVEYTDIVRYRCPWCGRASYHPDDIANEYCGCCGSADGLLTKDCEHTADVAIGEALERQRQPENQYQTEETDQE